MFERPLFPPVCESGMLYVVTHAMPFYKNCFVNVPPDLLPTMLTGHKVLPLGPIHALEYNFQQIWNLTSGHIGFVFGPTTYHFRKLEEDGL